MPGDPEPTDVFALLDDDCARAVLRATSQRPMSAPQLVEVCEASRATVYRRIGDLTDLDLLAESTEYDPEGDHRSVYAASLRRLSVELEDGEFRLRIEEDPADRVARLWEEL